MTKLTVTSEYIPDTTLHHLNGEYVVDLGGLKTWLAKNTPWIDADDADALADALKHAAALARRWKTSLDEETE